MNQIIHGDSYEILPTLPDKSFDTVIIDPPYGMGIDTWDTPVDVAFFTEQIKRIGKEFYAVFGQMPYIAEWHDEAKKAKLHFLEHISWVKRNLSPQKRLGRIHEDIFVYALTTKKTFYKTTGRYEDVKLPGVLFDIITIESIQRYIAELRCRLNGKHPSRRDKGLCHPTYKRLLSSASSSHFTRDPEFANYCNVWSFLPESQNTFNTGMKIHPTMKPVLLQERLVEMLTPEHGSVLDCFSGSGTTAIACQRLNRQFLCIEKQQDFYEYSLERLKGDTYQPDLNFTEN